MLFDPMYLAYVAPAFLLVLYAQYKVKSTYARMSRVPVRSGVSGAEAAEHVLLSQGVPADGGRGMWRTLPAGAPAAVTISMTRGMLGDHYNPLKRSLALSPDVYSGRSLAAVAIAAHEAGHAVQHATGYRALALRTGVANFATAAGIAPYMFFLGLIMHWGVLMNVAIGLFGAYVVFALVTLPVEFNASSRAMKMLTETGIVSADEAPAAKSVLNAAALTYVAAAAMALLQLLYFVMASRRN
ncbi:MAG: zinc metallopeptidase [Armatimonadota bacterium]